MAQAPTARNGEGGWDRIPGMERAASPVFATLFLSLLASHVAACSSAPPLPPAAVALNRDGTDALARGDLEVAEARFALAREYAPRFVEAWVNLGMVELRRGNLSGARKHLERARGLNGDLPAPHHGLGVLADVTNNPDGAMDHYRAALRVDPGFFPARLNLARCLFANGHFEEAAGQFLRATEVAPNRVEGWHNPTGPWGASNPVIRPSNKLSPGDRTPRFCVSWSPGETCGLAFATGRSSSLRRSSGQRKRKTPPLRLRPSPGKVSRFSTQTKRSAPPICCVKLFATTRTRRWLPEPWIVPRLAVVSCAGASSRGPRRTRRHRSPRC